MEGRRGEGVLCTFVPLLGIKAKGGRVGGERESLTWGNFFVSCSYNHWKSLYLGDELGTGRRGDIHNTECEIL